MLNAAQILNSCKEKLIFCCKQKFDLAGRVTQWPKPAQSKFQFLRNMNIAMKWEKKRFKLKEFWSKTRICFEICLEKLKILRFWVNFLRTISSIMSTIQEYYSAPYSSKIEPRINENCLPSLGGINRRYFCIKTTPSLNIVSIFRTIYQKRNWKSQFHIFSYFFLNPEFWWQKFEFQKWFSKLTK